MMDERVKRDRDRYGSKKEEPPPPTVVVFRHRFNRCFNDPGGAYHSAQSSSISVSLAREMCVCVCVYCESPGRGHHLRVVQIVEAGQRSVAQGGFPSVAVGKQKMLCSALQNT